MSTIEAKTNANGGGQLSNAQTGNGVSTNVVDRGKDRCAALLKLTTTVGATPTVTITIEGSMDGTNWYAIPYATAAAPGTITGANLVLTAAATTYYILQPNMPWRYVRLTYSANTNVTTTADVYGAVA